MTKDRIRRIWNVYAIAAVIALPAAIGHAQTSATETIKGTPTSTTKRLSGVVKYVEGDTLVVAMSTGSLRTFTVADDRKFVIDGKEVTVRDLKAGTTLTASVTTTTTPVTDRTTTNLSWTVWYVSGNTVILTLPNGKNKMYTSLPGYQFNVNGQKASVSALRKGMQVTAEKVVEEPATEVATNTVVTGHAPKASAAARLPSQ